MLQDALRPLLLTIAMIAAFAIAPVAPEAGNILYLSVGALALFCLRPDSLSSLARPVLWMPLLGLIVLAGAYSAAMGSLQGIAGLAFFLPLLLLVPLAVLAPLTAVEGRLVAALSLSGAAGTAAVAVTEFVSTGTSRVGLSVANPIHFADVSLVAGFAALLGLVYSRSVWRYIYLLGPIFASVAVLLSGTRGAVLALGVMAAAALVLALVMRLVTRKMILIGTVAAVVLGAGAIAAGVLQTSGVQRVIPDIEAVLQAVVPTDESTSERMQMYTGGLAAFLDSPVFGHGPFDYVAAAVERMTAPFDPPHLHSDLVNFAASGGLFGLVAYFLFLLAPLVEVFRMPRSPERTGLLVVIGVLVIGYFVMGLTNAVIGLLTLTVQFSAISVLVCSAAQALRGASSGARE